MKLAILLTILATFASLATIDKLAIEDKSATGITFGSHTLPFQIKAYPDTGVILTVSTSAKALILAKTKLAYALSSV